MSQSYKDTKISKELHSFKQHPQHFLK